MSLRHFHLVFIALSVVLAAFVAAWSTGQYRLAHEAHYVVTSVVAVAAGCALIAYGAAFQRKTKDM